MTENDYTGLAGYLNGAAYGIVAGYFAATTVDSAGVYFVFGLALVSITTGYYLELKNGGQ